MTLNNCGVDFWEGGRDAEVEGLEVRVGRGGCGNDELCIFHGCNY
jgi:hypothetical protein